MAIYEMTIFLTDLLTPLSKTENTILNTADFIKRIKKTQFQMDTKCCHFT